MIRARRVKFAFDGTPVHWVPGEPMATHTMNVLHLILPAGERWFCDLYRQALPLVTDGDLKADMKGFIGQEALHARAHDAALGHLAAQGIDGAPYVRRYEILFDKVFADRPFGLAVPRFLRRHWLVFRLGITSAIEHFTAVLGVWVIERSQALDTAGTDPEMLDLMRWHGAEEVEHRSVAHEVHAHLGGRYPGRVLAMAGTVPVLFTLFVTGVRYLYRHDPLRPGRPTWRAFLSAGRRGLLPTAGDLARAIPRYLRPGHHPSEVGSTEVALAYLATSPAAVAAASAR